MKIEIKQATDKDFEDGIWDIFRSVIAKGDSYIYPADTTQKSAHKIWMEDGVPYVAKIGDEIVGTYVIRPNRIGRGSHIANAGYMVSPNHRQKGIGRLMGLHSLEEARKLGYLAMQFNIVVSTNSIAVKLWQSIGFTIIGTIPEGYQHEDQGLVDIYIMYQKL